MKIVALITFSDLVVLIVICVMIYQLYLHDA